MVLLFENEEKEHTFEVIVVDASTRIDEVLTKVEVVVLVIVFVIVPTIVVKMVFVLVDVTRLVLQIR